MWLQPVVVVGGWNFFLEKQVEDSIKDLERQQFQAGEGEAPIFAGSPGLSRADKRLKQKLKENKGNK